MFKNKKKRNEVIVIIIFILAILLFRINLFKIINVTVKPGNLTYDELSSELKKYNCTVKKEELDNKIDAYYITDEDCPYKIEYTEFNRDRDLYYYNYLDKVKDNWNNTRTNTFSVNKVIVSIDSYGDSYKLMSFKNNSILYLNTDKINQDNANKIRENLGYKYGIYINFKYIVLPGSVLLIGIVGLIYVIKSSKEGNKKNDKMKKRKKKKKW